MELQIRVACESVRVVAGSVERLEQATDDQGQSRTIRVYDEVPLYVTRFVAVRQPDADVTSDNAKLWAGRIPQGVVELSATRVSPWKPGAVYILAIRPADA